MIKHLNYFKLARIIGVLLIIVAIVLSIKATKNEHNLPDGFFTPIIALEFIQNTQEVQQFFKVKDVEKYEQALLFGNNVDYAFMILYSVLLFCIALGIYQNTKSKLMYIVLFLCIVMCISDALENQQIAQIIFYYKTTSIETFLSKLYIFTWLKWSSISLTFLLFSSYFLKGNLFYKFIGTLGFTSLLLCIAAFFYHGILNEIFALNIVLLFLLMLIFVFTYNTKTAK